MCNWYLVWDRSLLWSDDVEPYLKLVWNGCVFEEVTHVWWQSDIWQSNEWSNDMECTSHVGFWHLLKTIWILLLTVSLVFFGEQPFGCSSCKLPHAGTHVVPDVERIKQIDSPSWFLCANLLSARLSNRIHKVRIRIIICRVYIYIHTYTTYYIYTYMLFCYVYIHTLCIYIYTLFIYIYIYTV